MNNMRLSQKHLNKSISIVPTKSRNTERGGISKRGAGLRRVNAQRWRDECPNACRLSVILRPFWANSLRPAGYYLVDYE